MCLEKIKKKEKTSHLKFVNEKAVATLGAQIWV